MAYNILKTSFWRGAFSSTDKLSSIAPDKLSSIAPDEDGMFPFFSLFNNTPQFNDYAGDIKKLNAIFTNPALLKVFSLQCDLFSLGKIKVLKNEKDQPDDPALRLLKNPNPLQSESQFLWDFMFYTMMGNAYCYIDSNIADNEANKLYMLNPAKMEWPREFENKKDKLIFSKSNEAELMKMTVKYTFEDGTSTNYPLSKIICIADLTNGIGNWFKGNSRIDALYKIISNSEASLDATNINTRFTGKFLVSGQQDPKNVTQLPMGKDEKDDIESKTNGRKQVHATRSQVDIKRFVSDMRALELGKAYLESYFLIGNMFNIPRDVLEAYNSSTYENQEKARASHVSYTLQPKGNALLSALAQRFGYHNQKKIITIDWSHLPFMQVFEKDKAITKSTQADAMTKLAKLGIPAIEINEFLGTNFKEIKYEQPKTNSGGNQGAG